MGILFVLFIIVMIFAVMTIKPTQKQDLEAKLQLAEKDYFMYLNSEQAKSENFLYKDYLLEKVKHAQRALDLFTHRQTTYSSSSDISRIDNPPIYTGIKSIDEINGIFYGHYDDNQ